MNNFENLGLSSELLRAVKEMGYENPTPVQEKAIPFLLENSRDLIALAQTGTGKTAAFGLPILSGIDTGNKVPQALVLCPTRELCLQITSEFKKFAKYTGAVDITAVYGGAPIERQLADLKKGTHIVVATPGRMLDIIRRKKIDLSGINRVVLDEADEMLQMGFQDDLNAILSRTPSEKQTLLFSATMPKGVTDIAMDYMYDPFEITIGDKNRGSKNIRHVYYAVNAKEKYHALKRILDSNPDLYGIIFCRTRQDAKDTSENLMKDGYHVEPLHGDLSHAQRESVMRKFRSRRLQVLVATDVAARGIDVDNLTHSVNYSLPEEPEVYTHRSGRTGRAGKTGTSLSIISLKEEGKIRRIEKLIGQKFEKLPIPSSSMILENQLNGFISKLMEAKITDENIASLTDTLLEKLSELPREEIIKRLLYLEFETLLAYYENAAEIREPKGRPERDRGNFRKRKGPRFSSNKGKTGKPGKFEKPKKRKQKHK